MKVTFAPHAQTTLNERGISFDKAIDTVRNPDRKEPTHRGRMKAVKRFEEREIHVIFIQVSKNDYEVITGYESKLR